VVASPTVAPLRHPAAAAVAAAPRRCVVCGQRFTPQAPGTCGRVCGAIPLDRPRGEAGVQRPQCPDCGRPHHPWTVPDLPAHHGRPRPSCAAWGCWGTSTSRLVPAGLGGPAPRPAGWAARHRRICTARRHRAVRGTSQRLAQESLSSSSAWATGPR
jgi:hypothetical protein